jgi:hypothetical protein
MERIPSSEPTMQMHFTQAIRDYFVKPTLPEDAPSWLSLPEIPNATEIRGNFTTTDLVLEVNKINGPWESKEVYFQAHYELIREDAIAPLREAVEELRAYPDVTEGTSKEKARIYENVCRLPYPRLYLLILGRFTLSASHLRLKELL